MTRVFYASCTKYDVLTRISVFEKELGWEPIAVITSFTAKESVKKAYPTIPVYARDYFYSNVSPLSGEKILSTSLLEDIEFIQPFVTNIYAMMDRFAHPENFTTIERRRYLRMLTYEWGAYLDEIAPDYVHFDETPHGTIGYIIYLLCKRRNIPTIWFRSTSFKNRILLQDSIAEGPISLTRSLEEVNRTDFEYFFKSAQKQIDLLRQSDTFCHDYMLRQEKTALSPRTRVENEDAQQRVEAPQRRLINLLKVWKYPLYITNVIRGTIQNVKAKICCKTVSTSAIIDEPISEKMQQNFQFPPTKNISIMLSEYNAHFKARKEYKEELFETYNAMTSDFDYFSEDYLFFPLHFQPERTTTPEAGVVSDQFIAIANLHNLLPEGWKLVVKEHPTEFNLRPYFATEIGRNANDYADFLSLSKVVLTDSSIPSSVLIRNSRATVTLTGTAGWESAINGVPGIHISPTWYQGFPGTFFAPNYKDLKDAIALISEGGYQKTNPSRETEWLKKLYSSSFSFDADIQSPLCPNTNSQEQIQGLTASMESWLLHITESL